MITVLTVNKKTKQGKAAGAFLTLRDKLECEIKISGGVTVEHYIYTQYGKKINWKRIKNTIGSARHELLCAENTELPENMGFSRFNSKQLIKRLSENTAMSALINAKINPRKLKLTLYDKRGQYSDFAQLLTGFTTNLKVITGAMDFYTDETDRIMEEQGCCVTAYDDIRRGFPCDVFLSPELIDRYIPSSAETLIITSCKPAVPIKGKIIFDYNFDLPDCYKQLKPESIDDKYFACALYSKGSVYNLGSVVPKSLISTHGVTNTDILRQSIVQHLT